MNKSKFLWLDKGTTRSVFRKILWIQRKPNLGRENYFIFGIPEGTMFQRPANNHLSVQQKGAIIALISEMHLPSELRVILGAIGIR
jgi:hypothetical protein